MSIENEIVREIELSVPVSRVWEALADSRQFGQWFRCTVDREFSVGALVTCRSTYAENEAFVWQKLIKAMEPERYFAFAWSPGETGADMYDDGGCKESAKESAKESTKEGAKESGETLVEFRLWPIDNGTRLEIRESGFANLPESHRAHSFRSNSEGWDAQVENVAKFFERGDL